MTWFKVDDSFHSHPKALTISLTAIGLWTAAGSWSSNHLTDGFVPDNAVLSLSRGAVELAEELVVAGLWRRTKGGYRFHQWKADSDGTPRNPTRSEAIAKRSKQSSGGAIGNHRRWHINKGVTDPDCCYCQQKPSSGNRPVSDRSTDTASESHPNPPDPYPTKKPACLSKEVTQERARENNPVPAIAHACEATPVPAPRPRGSREVAQALNATAHSAEARTILRKWADNCDEPLPQTTYIQLARQIDALRERGATGAYVWAALLTWDEKRRDGDKPKPGLLPYLHDEAKLEGLTAAQLYATPVEYLRDEDIDLYEVLGFDDVRIEAPDDIENGPMDVRRAWYENARAERRAVRCVQAREVITRRQEMRRNTKGAA